MAEIAKTPKSFVKPPLPRAVLRKAGKTIGRPKLEAPKVAISLRLDSKALSSWKASGPGWQTRMAESLKVHAPR